MVVSGSIDELDFSAVLRREERVVGVVCANRPADSRRLRAGMTEERQGALALPGVGDGHLWAGAV